MKDLTVLSAPETGADDSGVITRMIGMLGQGVSLRQPVAVLFGTFMAVPAKAAIDVAINLARDFVASGLPTLTDEQKAALSAQVERGALTLAQDVAVSLKRAPAVETGSGVTADSLGTRMDQEEELIGLQRGLELTTVTVSDARLQLQAWQWAVQRRLMGELFREFLAADDVATRIEIVADAGPVLELAEEQLTELRATRAEGQKIAAERAAEIEGLENDLLMVQTMQAVRDNRPVDDAVLKRMAVYYAERVKGEPPTKPATGTAKSGKGKSSKAKPSGSTLH